MKIFLLSIILFILITILIRYNNKEGLINNYKYTAIIIEPREHKALEFVLQNFNDNLSDDWQFIVFHGNKNKEYSENICKKVFIPERVRLINLNVDNLTIPEYNKLLFTTDFYNNISTDTFLVFQTDSIICNKHKDLINNFLEYDYVGAPWINGVGNGGLSLRKKSKMIKILNNCKHDDNTNEDVFFSSSCDNIVINKPEIETAKTFSIEHLNNNKSFGIHKAYEYLDINTINKWCPEINKLKELNIK